MHIAGYAYAAAYASERPLFLDSFLKSEAFLESENERDKLFF